VEDEQKVYVPTVEEAEAGGSPIDTQQADASGTNGSNPTNGSNGTNSASGIVNINTADRQVLMTLTGVGEKKADKIIEYREANGFFKTIDELMKVNGIGKSIFEGIKGQVTVGS
jgi:competence protein ComEA